MVFLPFICGITPVFAFSQDIEDAQVLLNSLGFDVGPEDGISGDRTKSALIEFYTSQNKTFDGVLSENELADLMDFIDEQAQKQSNTNQETSGPNPYLMPILVLLAVSVLIFLVAGKGKKSKATAPSSSLHSGQSTIRPIEEKINEYKPIPIPIPIPQPRPQPVERTNPPIVGKCHVIDGDTIVIGKQHIRFAGMNAPELNEPFGKQAKWALVELCKGQVITAYPNGETSYNRVVAKCFLPDGRDLAAEMVKMELALDTPHFPDADYKHLETPNSRRKLRWKPKKEGPG
jgi:micrococcal nuclease